MKNKERAINTFIDSLKNTPVFALYTALLLRAQSKKEICKMVEQLPLDIRMPVGDINRLLKPAWGELKSSQNAFKDVSRALYSSERPTTISGVSMAQYYRAYVDRERPLLDFVIQDDMYLLKFAQEGLSEVNYMRMQVFGTELYVYVLVSAVSNRAYVLLSGSQTGGNEECVGDVRVAEQMAQGLRSVPRYRLKVNTCGRDIREWAYTPVKDRAPILAGCVFEYSEFRSVCEISGLELAGVRPYGSISRHGLHYVLTADTVNTGELDRLINSKLGIQGRIYFK